MYGDEAMATDAPAHSRHPEVAEMAPEQDEPLTGMVVRSSHLLTRAEEMGLDLGPALMNVPEAGDEGELSILRQIMSATSVAELDSPWTAEGLAVYADRIIRVDAIRRAPSDFEDGLGWYLLLDIIDMDKDGERHTITTGSLSVCGQLIKAHALGALPLAVIPRRAKRPSRRGYFPMHLEICLPAAS